MKIEKLLSSSLFGHCVFQGMKQKNYVYVLYNPKIMSGILGLFKDSIAELLPTTISEKLYNKMEQLGQKQ